MSTIVPPVGPRLDQFGRITVGQFLKTPTQINRAIEALTDQSFISDYLFTGSPAEGGAVVYNRNVSPDSGLLIDGQDGRDVEAIDAGAEFPFVSPSEGVSDVAEVQKYGGAMRFSRETVRRDQRDVLARGLRMLSTTVVRKTNRIAVSTVTSDPDLNTLDVATPWSSADSDPIYDILSALSLVNDTDFGYEATTVLINKAQALALLGRESVRNQLPRESATLNPVLNPQLGGLLGVDWITSPFVPAGTAYVVDRNTLGALADEEAGIQNETYPEPQTQSTVVQAWRSVVPVVTDPKAGVKITGLAG